MNAIQTRYVEAKAACDALLRHGTEYEFDAATDAMLNAEEALINWALDSGQLSDEDTELFRHNRMKPEFTDRIVELALRLEI